MMINVMTHRALTHIAAKLYQPNMVENQCASNDIMVSNDQMGVVNPKITRNPAESLNDFLYDVRPPAKSSLYEYLASIQAQILYARMKSTCRTRKPGALRNHSLLATS